MSDETRYIICQKTRGTTRNHLRSLLHKEFPTVKVLKFRDPDYAVVLMDAKTEQLIRQALPQLSIEKDFQHKFAAA
jgi:hypothetical protein